MRKQFFLWVSFLTLMSTTALSGKIYKIGRKRTKPQQQLVQPKISLSDILKNRTSFAHIYVSTIPKSGSHLVTACVEYLTGKKENWQNEYVTVDTKKFFSAYHMAYSDPRIPSLKLNKYKAIFVYRDPRDILVSTAYWIQSNMQHYADFEDIKDNKSAVIDRLLTAAGDKHTGNCYTDYVDFIDDAFFLKVKFEDLVGPEGGGSKTAQIATIKRIAAHIGVPYNKMLIDYCADNLFGKPGTFRKGKIGSWKKELTDQQKQKATERFKRAIKQFGYPL